MVPNFSKWPCPKPFWLKQVSVLGLAFPVLAEMSDAARVRKRFAGDSTILADLLQPIVEPLGRSWVSYSEAQTTAKVTVNKELIGRAHSILAIVHSQTPNMAVTRSTWTSTVKLLLDANKHKPGWALKEADEPAYLNVMTCRLCNLCRAVAQGEQKSPSNPWVQALPWRSGSSAPVASPESNQPA